MTDTKNPSPAALAARRRRVETGRRHEAAAASMKSARPTHDQLMLPLLDEIQHLGGRARPVDLYERLAARLGVSEEIAAETKTFANGVTHNLWERRVRWARQTAILRGLLASPERGIWELTATGGDTLARVRPGVIVTIFETDDGVALWGRAEDAAAVIEKDSVNLIFVSPPYPISTARAYGGFDSASWLDWMKRLGGQWRELLTHDGSLMVNLGSAYVRGAPSQSPYIERFTLMMLDELGFHLADRLYWQNPNKLASPMPWVATRRVRCRSSIEPVLWFSRQPHPKADNRKVLTPYSDQTLARYIGKPGKKMERDSGYTFGANSFSADNGGAIPTNLITAVNGGPRDHYRRRCAETGLPPHPATFPEDVPERGILLTTDAGDLVYDPMAGSGVTAAAASRLGRRWITSEQALAYVRGSAFRFETAPGFIQHPLPAGLS